MFAASKSARSAAAGDNKFNYVTLLLNGDGTNGKQNNTFLDGSTNNFTITRNGTPTQGSFSPYGDLWSVYNTDAADNGFGVGANAALNMGTGDFTIEAWVNTAKLPTTNAFQTSSGGYQAIFATGPNLSASGSQLYIGTTNLKFDISTDGGGPIDVAHNMVAGQWYHIAITRSGTTFRAFINGTLVQTATSSTSWVDSYGWGIGRAEPVGSYTGAWWYGYISNFRAVKGTALYTSSFVPSTTPLTAVSGTALLVAQSNRFIDNSTNNFTITFGATKPSVQRFSPFEPSTSYTPAVNGGSGYFNGSSDYLNIADNAALQVAAGDFTIEAWVYPSSLPSAGNYKTLWSKRTALSGVGGYGGACLIMDSTGALQFFVASNSTTWGLIGTSTGLSITIGTWQHLAMVRSGNNLILYKNGVAGSTVSLTFSVYDTGPLTVMAGSSTSGQNVDGYMTDFRLVKGTAVYTSTFTPPTAPLTAVTNTSLLLNYTNAGISDAAAINDLTTVGNAQVNTSIVKYGSGSMSFNGTSDYLKAIDTPNINFGTGDFTLECWIYVNSFSSNSAILDKRVTSGGAAPWVWYTDTAGKVNFYTGTNYISTSTFSLNTWTHVAVCRSGGVLYQFINGVSVMTPTSVTTNLTTTATMLIGTSNDASPAYFKGYIDDLRVTKGYARYTANFTPPTAALPTF